jgi:hypothetical protein
MALIKLIQYIKTRPHIGWGLVFCFCLVACKDSKQEKAAIAIVWENDRAVALAIPIAWFEKIAADSIMQSVQVRLQKSNAAILGEYLKNDTAVLFRPVIPFTRGLHYEIWVKEKLAGEIIIPGLSADEVPRVQAIYPTRDTIPVNILKIHLRFSKAMQEGQALQKIVLIKNGRDTVSSAFLELQQELWNKERTLLTIWFDPGRIKRDLQPNLMMGPPLDENANYLLIIKKDWQDTHGVPLASDYRREFVTGARDNHSPDISKWKINVPSSGSDQPLVIDAGESLDYVLLTAAIQIMDERGTIVAGKIVPGDEQKVFSFIPSQSWKPGEYTLRVEARLEDLAGNNLSRLFDNDLSAKQPGESVDLFTRPFRVK